MKQKITLFFLLMCSIIFAKAQENIALNKVAIASSGNAALAVNGNPAQRWESVHNVDPQWIYVDLGAEYNISEIKITWESARAKAYVIEVSNDITNWGTPVVTETNNPAVLDPQCNCEDKWIINYSGLNSTGRYVRIYGTSRMIGYGYSIYSLEVQGNLTAVGIGSGFAPKVNITAPANNATFAENQSITMQANATSEAPNSVERVEFYLDGMTASEKVGESLTAPYSYTFTSGLPLGAHTIRAKAFDNKGNFTYTAEYKITVELPVIIPSCGGLGLDGDYTYKFSWDANNPTITFIPNPNRPTVGNSTLIFYYGTSATDPLPGSPMLTPNVPYQLTASEGTPIYFYYTYNSPTGEKNNVGNRYQFTIGSCGASTNLALKKPVTASSGFGTAKDAVDGSMATRWMSGNDPDKTNPQWIYVDLNEIYDINRVKILWEGAYAENYTIDISENATSWTTIKTVTGKDSGVSGLTDDHTGLSGQARYVRISGTLAKTIYGYSLWEMEVYGGPEGTLPVSLIDFTAKAQTSGTVSLNWSTASEQGNDYFLLERSADGKNFSRLTEIPSKGSNNKYQYTDTQPHSGNNYYRLTQVDKDGKSKELGIQSVSFSLAKQNNSIYPNPLQGNTFHIALNKENNDPITVTISNLMGKEVYSGNFTSSDIKVELNSKLPSGIYIVKAGAQQTFKLHVQ